MPSPKRFLIYSVVLAILVYFWGSGSMQIPKIGDEVLYLQIARVTGESGSWLPLRYEPGIFSTKPPLLYWLGIASTQLFGSELFFYRLPVLLVTLLGAFLVYVLALKYIKNRSSAVWAACAYLGFISTFQHGRPFLVNSFEVFFLILPLLSFYLRPQFNLMNWFVCVLSWGAVAWSKSFALIGVGAFSLYWSTHYLSTQRSSFISLKKLLYFGSAVVVSLGIFALWFVFDPDPALLYRQFIIGENAVKFKGYAHYFSGIFTGGYTVFRIWLAPLANAGLFAFLLLGLAIFLYRQRHKLSREDKAMLVYILAFLIFYSLPTQRQENYILPAMAVIALLLAKYREQIAPLFWKISLGLLHLSFAVLTLAPIILSLWKQLSLPAIILWFFAIKTYFLVYFIWRGRVAFPLMVFLCYLQLSVFSEPFNQRFSYFGSHPGEKVWVPSRKLAQHERFRFIAPGSIPVGYSPLAGDPCKDRAAGSLLIIEEEQLIQCESPYQRIEQVLDFKTRQKPSELIQIATGRTEFLLRNLVLIKVQE